MPDHDEKLRALAADFGMDFIRIPDVIDPAILALLAAEVAVRHHALPVAKNFDRIWVAISNPLDVDTVEALRLITKLDVEVVIAPEAEIQVALKKFYG